jgi:hypothetical protein
MAPLKNKRPCLPATSTSVRPISTLLQATPIDPARGHDCRGNCRQQASLASGRREQVRSIPELLIRAMQWNIDTAIIQALVEACPDALPTQDEDGGRLSPGWLGDLIKRSS